MQNFRTENPIMFDMMGDFYKLVEKCYPESDLKIICSYCDEFNDKWENQLSGLDKLMAERLVMGMLEAIDKNRTEERKNGRT